MRHYIRRDLTGQKFHMLTAVKLVSDVGRSQWHCLCECVDRIDNSRGYEPGNVRWATAKQQANNKRTNVVVEFNGEALTIKQWSEKTGIHANTISSRLKVGCSVGEALTRKTNRRVQFSTVKEY